MHIHIQSLFRRRLLVAVAIGTMVGSAAISFFLVHMNERHLAAARVELQEDDQTIRNLWEDAQHATSMADTAVIVSLLARNDPAQGAALQHYYLSRIDAAATGRPLLEILEAADASHTQTINRINDIYIGRDAISRDITGREERNSFYASLAFFLQLISLVLIILTRDMPDL